MRKSPVNFRIKRPDFKSWSFAAISAGVLGCAVLLDQGLSSAGTAAAEPCQVEVTADVLDVRSGPDPDAGAEVVLHRGDRRGAENTVQNGYRQLADGWALDTFLRPLPGSTCTTS